MDFLDKVDNLLVLAIPVQRDRTQTLLLLSNQQVTDLRVHSRDVLAQVLAGLI